MAQDGAERAGAAGSPIVREVRIDAAPETVFEFFVDPEKLVRWKGRAASLDGRPGGVYRVDISPRDVVRGEYVVVDRPRRVVFTWGWEGHDAVPPGSSTVEIDLTPDGDGTLIRLTHRDLPPDALESHVAGWEHYLPRLATVTAGGDAGPDPFGEQM